MSVVPLPYYIENDNLWEQDCVEAVTNIHATKMKEYNRGYDTAKAPDVIILLFHLNMWVRSNFIITCRPVSYMHKIIRFLRKLQASSVS